MTKTHTQYPCQQCGRISAKLMGRCPQCGAWNSMVEEIISSPKKEPRTVRGLVGKSIPQRLSEVAGDEEDRLPLSIHEFSRVLGGGIVPGSIILIGGDPGIGKSTLLLQVAMQMALSNCVLYTSGEESERQIKMRALRLQSSNKNSDEDISNLPQICI